MVVAVAEQRPGRQGTAPLAEEGPVMTSAAGTCLPSGGKSVPGISAEVCLELLLLLLLAGLPNGQPTSMQRGRPREPAAGTNGKRLPATRWSRGRIAFSFPLFWVFAGCLSQAPGFWRSDVSRSRWRPQRRPKGKSGAAASERGCVKQSPSSRVAAQALLPE